MQEDFLELKHVTLNEKSVPGSRASVATLIASKMPPTISVGPGTLKYFLPLVQKNASRGFSVTQLVSRFATLNLRHVQSPTISAVTKLGAPLDSNIICAHKVSALKSVPHHAPSFQQPVRALTYCSLRKGKRKSVKSVVKRFLRLHCGLWVRRKVTRKDCGRKELQENVDSDSMSSATGPKAKCWTR
ncbi:39S ribosomal protein L35, mitochondrial isoform X2 [Carcharodon carcharias]|uniref:39S ribosomal protein L35, mitochondrial isoform X2 n=1 Tax=Carcharodon carcharias TaxID=13397 RepID=UPI001B7F57F0|nr:39S ribosomal protein L35, mitochondrial isoform X2 [Carcharodon carcharias]